LPSTAAVAPPSAAARQAAVASQRHPAFRHLLRHPGFRDRRAEHNWEFTEDGHYRLRGMTRTSGLAALIKPLVFENESSGRLVAGGLQPEQYRTRKNGKDANENADFDWSPPKSICRAVAQRSRSAWGRRISCR
jgi:hypothetical protein